MGGRERVGEKRSEEKLGREKLRKEERRGVRYENAGVSEWVKWDAYTAQEKRTDKGTRAIVHAELFLRQTKSHNSTILFKLVVILSCFSVFQESYL